MKIQAYPDTTGYAPRDAAWCAYDVDSYDCDCDQDGFFSTHPVGLGATSEAAIADLMEQLEDA